MRIGVISDTHNPSVSPVPPPEVERAFAGVDLILHCGDIFIPSCLDWLEQIAPVWAVELGSKAHFSDDARVAEKRVLELEGYSIGMVHDLVVYGMGGEATPGVIEREFPSDRKLSEALAGFFGAPVNVVVFGHTHHAMVEKHDGILLVNPGSPGLPKQVRRLGQIAILELSPEGPEARIVELSDFS